MNPSCSALNQSCDTGQEIRRVANKLHPPNSAAPVKDPVIFWGCVFFKRTLRRRLLSLQDRRISERHGAALPNAATNWTNRSYATADCHGYGATGLHHTPALPVHNFVLWCHCHWHLFVLVFLPFVFSQANCH